MNYFDNQICHVKISTGPAPSIDADEGRVELEIEFLDGPLKDERIVKTIDLGQIKE